MLCQFQGGYVLDFLLLDGCIWRVQLWLLEPAEWNKIRYKLATRRVASFALTSLKIKIGRVHEQVVGTRFPSCVITLCKLRRQPWFYHRRLVNQLIQKFPRLKPVQEVHVWWSLPYSSNTGQQEFKKPTEKFFACRFRTISSIGTNHEFLDIPSFIF